MHHSLANRKNTTIVFITQALAKKAVHRNTSKVINSFEMYLILLRALFTEHFIPKGFSKILPTTYCILMLPQFGAKKRPKHGKKYT